MANLNTVNVIEMWQEKITGLASYPDTPEGNKEAENRFRMLAKTNTRYSAADIEVAIVDGVAEYELGSIFLVHSTI